MRICLVSQEYPPETARGGIGTQTYAKTHGLSALGHEVIVVSASPTGGRTDRRDGAVRVIRTPGYHHRMGIYSEAAAWLTYSAEVAAEVSSLHAVTPLDLVEFPEWAGEGFVHVLNQTEWNRIPTVVQIHGPVVMFAETVGWPEQDSDLCRLGRMMEETCLRRADAVYASSRYSAQWCSRHYGTRDDIPVLHTGVDTALFRPRREEARPLTILFVGRIDPQKGADLVFEAASVLAGEMPGLALRMVGRADSNLARNIARRARERGLERLVEFAGYVPHDELPGEFAKADVMAAPSRGEGGPGFVYLEAMACGVPVIACREEGVSDSILDGQTGFLIGSGNLEELTAALRQLLTDRSVRQVMGARAREHVLATADSRRCIAGIEAFYRQAAAGVVAATSTAK